MYHNVTAYKRWFVNFFVILVPLCRMPKITNDGLTRSWHKLLYSCIHVATVGVKGLRMTPVCISTADAVNCHCYVIVINVSFLASKITICRRATGVQVYSGSVQYHYYHWWWLFIVAMCWILPHFSSFFDNRAAFSPRAFCPEVVGRHAHARDERSPRYDWVLLNEGRNSISPVR